MPTITIPLREDYQIPPVVSNLTQAEWEVVLTALSDLLIKHDTVLCKLNDQSIRDSISNKFQNQIGELTNKITEYEAKLESAKVETSRMREQREIELADLRKTLCQSITASAEAKYTSMIEAERQIVASKTRVIDQLNKDLLEINNSQTAQLQDVQTKYKKIIEQIEDKHRADQQGFHDQVKQKLEQTQQALNDQKVLFTKLEEQYKARIESIEQRYKSHILCLEKQNASIADLHTVLQTKLDPIVKHYTGSNEEKGASGENLVLNTLQSSDMFYEATITNTSSQTTRGDVLMKWKTICCLFEVKNKNAIVKDDLNKFTRDIIESSTSEHKINCGVFCSLQTNIIPGRSREPLQLDYINGIPVVYVYVRNPQVDITCAILLLEKILASRDATTEDTQLLQKEFIKSYNATLELKIYFEKQIEIKRRELKQLINQLEMTTQRATEMSPIQKRLVNRDEIIEPIPEAPTTTEVVPDEATNDPVEQLTGDDKNKIQQITEYCIQQALVRAHPTITQLIQHFAIDQLTLDRLGGYQRLIAMAKFNYTKLILTDNIVKQIVEHHKQNKSYPTRQELVSKKIITDNNIRKLSRVVDTKKILDHIILYCSQRPKQTDYKPN